MPPLLASTCWNEFCIAWLMPGMVAGPNRLFAVEPNSIPPKMRPLFEAMFANALNSFVRNLSGSEDAIEPESSMIASMFFAGVQPADLTAVPLAAAAEPLPRASIASSADRLKTAASGAGMRRLRMLSPFIWKGRISPGQIAHGWNALQFP